MDEALPKRARTGSPKAKPIWLQPPRFGRPWRSNSNAAESLPNRRRPLERHQPLALEEPHLPARELPPIVVVQPSSLRSDRYTVDLRIVVFLAAVHVHDEVAFGAAGNGRNLHARTAQSSERLGELEFAAGKGAAQHLELGLRQRRGILRHAGTFGRHRLGGFGLGGLIHRHPNPPNAFLTLR